jgi:hypothetical protein
VPSQNKRKRGHKLTAVKGCLPLFFFLFRILFPVFFLFFFKAHGFILREIALAYHAKINFTITLTTEKLKEYLDDLCT